MDAPGSEQAIVGITRWARRGAWRARLDLIIDAHFGPVLGRTELPAEELPARLGEAFAPLFACVLEDFLTCDFGPEQRSIVTDYLKRRGFKERAPVRRYLRTLQRSVMSVYQVVQAAPGGDLVLRDLIRGGDPVRVEERPGTIGLEPADRIAARLLPIDERTYMASGWLRLPAERVPELVRDIRRTRQRFRRWLGREARRRGHTVAELEAIAPLDDAVLGELAPVFTHVWLSATLEPLLGGRHPDAPAGEPGWSWPALEPEPPR